MRELRRTSPFCSARAFSAGGALLSSAAFSGAVAGLAAAAAAACGMRLVITGSAAARFRRSEASSLCSASTIPWRRAVWACAGGGRLGVGMEGFIALRV